MACGKITVNKYLLAIAAFSISLLSLVMGFNYVVDPMSYYHCPEVDLAQRTQNVYYQTAQTAVANSDAEVLILGSSRGETTPPQWIEEVTGKKTVNLSQSGADLLLKMAVLNSVLEKGSQVKKVIWLADYFDLVRSWTDVKVRTTPVLRRHLGDEGKISAFTFYTESLSRLINHNSTEAALEHLKNNPDSMFSKKGRGSQIDFKACMQPDFQGEVDEGTLLKKIESSYSGFSKYFAEPQDPIYWDLMEKQIKDLENRGIEVLILIAPMHNKFISRLYKDHPMAKVQIKTWLDRLQALSSEKVRVVSYYDEGVPGDDEGPSFWNDGAHTTCKSMTLMLDKPMRDFLK